MAKLVGMFVVWGQYRRKERLGRVADYCPRCRDAAAFRLVDHWQVNHLYYLPLGRGKLVETTITCERCRREFPGDGRRYLGTVRDRRASLEHLCDATNPTLPEQVATRLDALDRAARGESDPDERAELIADAFNAVLADYEKRTESMHFNVWSAIAALAIVPAAIGAFALGASIGLDDEALIALVLTAVGVMVALMVVALALDPGRYYRRHTRPELVALLAPIRPTASELEAVKQQLRKSGAKLHKRIDPAQLAALATEIPPHDAVESGSMAVSPSIH